MFYRIFILVSVFIVGCSNSSQKQSDNQDTIIDQNKDANIVHGIGEVLTPEARKLVASWEEYAIVENLISEYYSITPTKATANALELSNATQQLKDSIRIERFKEPNIKIRLNVLHNTALRLTDIEQIPQISDQEIETEINNLINAFSSITNKLNNIVRQEVLEKELINYN